MAGVKTTQDQEARSRGAGIDGRLYALYVALTHAEIKLVEESTSK